MSNKSPGRLTSEDLYSPDDTKAVGISLYEKQKRSGLSQTVYTILGKGHSYDDDGVPVIWDIKCDDGQIEYAEDTSDACAKVTSNKGVTQYHIKTGHGGQFYNPVGLYEGAGRKSNAQRLGRHEYNWVQVNSKAFHFYLEFLRTKHNRYIVNAQREVM